MGLKTNKNFITSNAVEAILAVSVGGGLQFYLGAGPCA